MSRTNFNLDKNYGKRSRPPPKLAFNSSKTFSKANGGNKTTMMPQRVVVNAAGARGGSNGAGSSSSSTGSFGHSSSSSSGSERGGASQRVQFAERQKEKEKKNADADIVELEPPMKKKPPPPDANPSAAAAKQQLQIVPRTQQQLDAAGKVSVIDATNNIFQLAKIVNSICANSNAVTFHDVDTLRGTIGKITIQFQCHKCRGQLGIARCFRGAAFCISCCGHPHCGGNQLEAPGGGDGGNGGQ